MALSCVTLSLKRCFQKMLGHSVGWEAKGIDDNTSFSCLFLCPQSFGFILGSVVLMPVCQSELFYSLSQGESLTSLKFVQRLRWLEYQRRMFVWPEHHFCTCREVLMAEEKPAVSGWSGHQKWPRAAQAIAFLSCVFRAAEVLHHVTPILALLQGISDVEKAALSLQSRGVIAGK